METRDFYNWYLTRAARMEHPGPAQYQDNSQLNPNGTYFNSEYP